MTQFFKASNQHIKPIEFSNLFICLNMSILTRCQVFKSWIVLESTRSINIFQWISAVLARKSNCIIDWIVIYLVANVNLIEQLWLVQKAVNIAMREDFLTTKVTIIVGGFILAK